MRINLLMGIVWLCGGVTLLGARFFSKPINGMDPDRAAFIGMFALVLAGWNFIRWWAARARQKAREAAAATPPKKRPLQKPPTEYHPEFDFTRTDRPPQ